MRSALATVLVLLAAAGCSCDEERARPKPPEAASTADPTYSHATIRKTCGPMGSQSLLLVLARSGEGCEPVAEERVTISITTTEIVAPATLVLSGFGSAGTGRSCPRGGGPCELAQTGKLVVERYAEDAGISGRFELELPKLGPMRGRYAAKWCPAEVCADAG